MTEENSKKKLIYRKKFYKISEKNPPLLEIWKFTSKSSKAQGGQSAVAIFYPWGNAGASTSIFQEKHNFILILSWELTLFSTCIKDSVNLTESISRTEIESAAQFYYDEISEFETISQLEEYIS